VATGRVESAAAPVGQALNLATVAAECGGLNRGVTGSLAATQGTPLCKSVGIYAWIKLPQP